MNQTPDSCLRDPNHLLLSKMGFRSMSIRFWCQIRATLIPNIGYDDKVLIWRGSTKNSKLSSSIHEILKMKLWYEESSQWLTPWWISNQVLSLIKKHHCPWVMSTFVLGDYIFVLGELKEDTCITTNNSKI